MAKGSILIVDQDAGSAELLRRILASRDYRVRSVRNGEQALSAAIDPIPDLILFGMHEGPPDAFELARRLRADARISDVPFILVGSPREGEAIQALRLGAADVIYKPLRSGEVVARVCNCLERSRANPQAGPATQETEPSESRGLESVGLLTIGVAHDFSSLLSSILVNAENALEAGDGGEEVRGSLEGIRAVAIRASEVVSQLMRIADHRAVEFEPTDLVGLVGELVRLMRSSIAGNCRIETRFPDADLLVRANPAQVRQVVLNLVRNAADAIGDRSGLITLRIFPQRIQDDDSGLQAGDYVELDVTDTGSGMTEETQAHVFQAFFTTKSGGHGFGLAALRTIVAEHGGSIGFESEPGRGTTFRLLLPRWREGALAGAAGSAARRNTAPV